MKTDNYKHMKNIISTKRLHSSLKLGYAPVSNEELAFENIAYDDNTCRLSFEIHKKVCNTKLTCSLCIYQENIEPVEGQIVATELRRKGNIIPGKEGKNSSYCYIQNP